MWRRPTSWRRSTLHKEMLGTQCQQLIYVTMHFDANRCISQRQIEGGELLEIGDCV